MTVSKSVLLILALLFTILGTASVAKPAKTPVFPEVPGESPNTPQSTSNSPSLTSPTNLPGDKAIASMDALDDLHTLAIGDRLSFRIIEDEEEPKSLVVMDSGELEVPYIGRYSAVGLSCKQLAQRLKKEFEKEYYYKATVIVAIDQMSKTRGRIYIVGPVRSPGPQEIPSDEILTLSKAILRAGGLSDYADSHKVRITRKGDGPDAKDKDIIVDVSKILDKGKRDSDVVLQPDDLIFIPERLVRF